MLPIQLPSSTQTARSSPLSAHMKNKSEFQVTIQSIPSQSAIIGWRHMAAELKSIGQWGWRRPNWCQLRLQRYCRNTGLPYQPLRQTTFNSLYHSSRTASLFIPLSCLVFPSSAQGEKLKISAVLEWSTIMHISLRCVVCSVGFLLWGVLLIWYLMFVKVHLNITGNGN